MDFGKAFTFVFEDDGWITKLLIGGIILLIPIIGWLVVAGWMLEIGRRVAAGEPAVLPDWNDFGAYLVRGLKAFVVGLVYSLPVIILELCPVTLTMLTSSNGQGDMSTMVSMVNLLVGCVVFVYDIFLAFVLPAALMRFTMNDDNIGAGLAFGEVFRMVQENVGAYLIVVLGTLVAGLVGGLGAVVCVGVIFTLPYASAIQGHLYGQAYAVATGGAMPVDAPPAAPADWNG